MQRFARWTNLSETTFLLPPAAGTQADHRLKVFTPVEELPFAGHPTLGSCHSFLRHLGASASAALIAERARWKARTGMRYRTGRASSLRRCYHGAVPRAPDFIRHEPVDSATVSRITKALCLDANDIVDAYHIDNGPRWIGIKLKTAQQVLDIDVNSPQRDIGSIRDLFLGFIGPYPGGKNAQGESVANEVRAFVFEDIGRGPGHRLAQCAGFAKWLESCGESPAGEYTNSQGTAIGRKGRGQCQS